jgi:hypothetical protein
MITPLWLPLKSAKQKAHRLCASELTEAAGRRIQDRVTGTTASALRGWRTLQRRPE